MSDQHETLTRNASRSFKESDESVYYMFLGRIDEYKLREQYASLFTSANPLHGGSFSAAIRLGPSELRALADELKAAADFLETHNPNKP